MLSVPPPAGSLYACAQLPAGDGTSDRAWPFSSAVQPQAGSANISVPPPAGTDAPETPTGPEGTATTVPSGLTTLTRDGSVFSCQSEYPDVLLYGCNPLTLFSTVASCLS